MFWVNIDKVSLMPYSGYFNTSVAQDKVSDLTKKVENDAALIKVFLKFDDFLSFLALSEFKDTIQYLKLAVAVSDDQSDTVDVIEDPTKIFRLNCQILSVKDFYINGKFTPFSTNFILSSGTTKHLTCFALPYLEKEEFCTKFGIDVDVMNLGEFYGDLVYERVVENNVLISTKYRNYFVKTQIDKSFVDAPAEPNKSFFTDILLSEDTSRNIRGLFGVHLMGFCQKYTNFGKYFTNLPQLLENVSFKKVDIKKKRVQSDQKKSNFIDASTIEDVLCQANETVLVPNYKFFTFTDKTPSVGEYQYGSRIYFEDKTYTFFKNSYQNLAEANSIFVRYYNESSACRQYNDLNESFSAIFVKNQLEKYQNISSPWVSSIEIYINTLKALTSGLDYARIQFDLLTLTQPDTGSIVGMELFILLLQDLQNRINTILGTNIYSGTAGTQDGITLDTSIVVENLFASIWKSELNKNVYNVLNISETQNDGPITISAKDFQGRLREEFSKYYTDKISSINLNGIEMSLETVYCSYLTLASSYIDGKQVSYLSGNISLENAQKTFFDLGRKDINAKQTDVVCEDGIVVNLQNISSADTLSVGQTLEKSSFLTQESKTQDNAISNIQQPKMLLDLSSTFSNKTFSSDFYNTNKSENALEKFNGKRNS